MLPTSVFAASFTPDSSDYAGERWGQATYRPETIASLASDEGLTCAWDEVHPYGQQWVLFFRDDRIAETASAPRSRATPDVRDRFHSDFRDAPGWEVHTHGASGGLESGRYSSGAALDHLATVFLDKPEVSGIVFFSVRVKPDQDARLPAVSLQGDDLSVLGRALPRERDRDGWVFMAGWVHGCGDRRVRLLIQQPLGTSCRLDKALLVITGEGGHEQRPGD